MTNKDGRIEVAIAISQTTNLVEVNPNAKPFTTVPDDLFDICFNDPKVGIDDQQMAIFKKYLKILLPAIKTDINKIPDNANQLIEDVAKFVKLSLLVLQMKSLKNASLRKISQK